MSAEREIQMDIYMYMDNHSIVYRTGLLKYYFPLPLRVMFSKTLDELWTLNETVPMGYDEDIPDVINATQFNIDIVV